MGWKDLPCMECCLTLRNGYDNAYPAEKHCIKSDYNSIWTFCRSVEHSLSSGSIYGERREKEQQQQQQKDN